MSFRLLFASLLVPSALLAHTAQIEMNDANVKTALSGVIFAYVHQSTSKKFLRVDLGSLVAPSVEYLKGKNVPASWASPVNQSEAQLLKAFLGTRMACSSTIQDADDNVRLSVKSSCRVTRREVSDPSKQLTFENTTDIALWEPESPEAVTLESSLIKTIQGQLNGLFDQFALKYKNNEFKTKLSESYQAQLKK